MIDFEAARATMVDTQLRTDRVTDRRVLAAFAALPRERFVPAAKRDLAYSDAALEVWPSFDGGPARYLLPPVVLARLIQLASVEAKRPPCSILAAPPATRPHSLPISRRP